MPIFNTKVFYNMPPNLRLSFPGRLLKLSESGLDNLWMNWAEFWNSWNDTLEAARNKVHVRSVSLYDSNVRVIFLMFLVLIFVPFLVFLVEVLLLFIAVCHQGISKKMVLFNKYFKWF